MSSNGYYHYKYEISNIPLIAVKYDCNIYKIRIPNVKIKPSRSFFYAMVLMVRWSKATSLVKSPDHQSHIQNCEFLNTQTSPEKRETITYFCNKTDQIVKTQQLVNLLLSENLMTLLEWLYCWVDITILSSVVSLSTPSTISQPRKNQWRQCSL